MKYKIIIFLMLITIIFTSCDTDYSGDTSNTFNMYYAVDADTLSSYSLEFYVNSTNGIISLSDLTEEYISDSLVMNVTESDSFYMKLNNSKADTLIMIVFKGVGIHKSLTVEDSGEFIIQGRFDQE